MIDAVQTHPSPAGIWAIAVVAVASLVFWLAVVAIASRKPGASGRPPRGPGAGGSVLGGTHVAAGGRSVAPNRDAPATLAGAEPDAAQDAAPGAAVPPRQRTAEEPAAPPREPAPPTEPAAPPGRARVPRQRPATTPAPPARLDPRVRQGRAG